MKIKKSTRRLRQGLSANFNRVAGHAAKHGLPYGKGSLTRKMLARGLGKLRSGGNSQKLRDYIKRGGIYA